MPTGVYDRTTAKQYDRSAVGRAAATPEARARMSASAATRTYRRRPCEWAEGCDKTVTTRSRSGLCRYHQTRAWKKANPDKVNAANRHYNARRPEVMRASRARWAEAHPHACAERAAVRRARKQGQFVEKVYKSKVWKRDAGICGICHDPADPADWHLDHVIPLARGGEHSYANTQVSHPACNLRKAAST